MKFMAVLTFGLRTLAPLLLLALFLLSAFSSSLVHAQPATIIVGSEPYGIAYDSAKGELFVANHNSGWVSVISDSTNAATASVPVGSEPFGITYDSAKGKVFVSNYGANSVSVISDSTNAIVATVKGLNGPQSLAYDSCNIADQHGLRDIRLDPRVRCHPHRLDYFKHHIDLLPVDRDSDRPRFLERYLRRQQHRQFVFSALELSRTCRDSRCPPPCAWGSCRVWKEDPQDSLWTTAVESPDRH